MQHVLINLFIVYSIIVMPTLYIKFCGPSIDGVIQEACDFHCNIIVMNLNLKHVFQGCMSQTCLVVYTVCYHSTTVGKARTDD